MTNELRQPKDKDGDDEFFFFQENLPFIKDKDQKAPGMKEIRTTKTDNK